MAQSPILFTSFIIFSVLAALTEGLSVSLLIPILDSQAMGSSFSDIPVLGLVSKYFDGMQGKDKLVLAAIFLLVVVILRGALQMIVQALSIMIPIRVQRTLTTAGYKYLLSAGMGYINRHEVGEHLNNVKERPLRITSLLKTSADTISLLLVLIIFTYMMLLISWKMTIISIFVLGFFSICLMKFTSGPVRKLGFRTSGAYARYNQTLYETLEGMQLIRLKAAESVLTDRLDRTLNETLEIQQRTGIYYAIPGPALSTAVGAFICGLLFFTATYVETETQELTSQLILFLFLLMRLMTPISGLNQCRHVLLSNKSALDETEEFLADIKEQIQLDGNITFEHLNSKVEFKNVSFSYDNSSELVIKDFSTTIKKGEMIAIIGPSGAGKSTLVGLMSRLYDPLCGEIVVDDTRLQDLQVSSWRKRISVVSQDTTLFNDTILNNISFGHKNITKDDVIAAAKKAAAHAFIQALPEGYDTMIGDRGVKVSGGQKQRIAIARAFLSEPELLIMDEGTSNLDSITEHQVQGAIENLSVNRTVLIIAHRLSTIRRADKILVVDKGRIVEEGRHSELMEQRGIYWDMLKHQRLELLDEEESASNTIHTT